MFSKICIGNLIMCLIRFPCPFVTISELNALEFFKVKNIAAKYLLYVVTFTVSESRFWQPWTAFRWNFVSCPAGVQICKAWRNWHLNFPNWHKFFFVYSAYNFYEWEDYLLEIENLKLQAHAKRTRNVEESRGRNCTNR